MLGNIKVQKNKVKPFISHKFCSGVKNDPRNATTVIFLGAQLTVKQVKFQGFSRSSSW